MESCWRAVGPKWRCWEATSLPVSPVILVTRKMKGITLLYLTCDMWHVIDMWLLHERPKTRYCTNNEIGASNFNHLMFSKSLQCRLWHCILLIKINLRKLSWLRQCRMYIVHSSPLLASAGPPPHCWTHLAQKHLGPFCIKSLSSEETKFRMMRHAWRGVLQGFQRPASLAPKRTFIHRTYKDIQVILLTWKLSHLLFRLLVWWRWCPVELVSLGGDIHLSSVLQSQSSSYVCFLVDF